SLSLLSSARNLARALRAFPVQFIVTSCLKKMADTSDSDGVENRVSDHESNPRHSSAEISKYAEVSDSDTPLTASVPKRVKMDGDGDGAPSSVEASPRHQKGDHHHYQDGGGGDGTRSTAISFDSSAESTPKRTITKRSSAPSTPQTPGQDLSVIDMKMSWDGSVSGGSAKGEPTDGETGYKVAFKARAGMLADPVKIAKEREKEERVRQARERLMAERRKKLEELKEQQRIAQENREKQLEMRRKKIEDLRRRDYERRAAVEERRKMKEDIERARRESILQKAEERVARYEAWKAGGRKGGRGHILGFGSATPRDICQPFERPRRSSSHSALQRRSPNGSDMDSMRPQRRALSACSAVRRHCCVDYNRIGMFGDGPCSPRQLSVSTSVLYHKRSPEFSSMSVLAPASRPDSALGLNTIRDGRRSFVGPHTSVSAIVAGYQRAAAASSTSSTGTPLTRASMTASMPGPVRMRENKVSRKQRPASVASSMPSFVGGEPAKSPRSKSSDRTGRDRSKTRSPRKDEKAAKDKENHSERAQKPGHKEEKDEEKDSDKDGDKESPEKKDKKSRVSLSFFDRLATPKYSKKDADHSPKDVPSKKESPAIRVQFAGDEDGDQDGVVEPELSPRKAYSTPNLSGLKKRSSIRDRPTHSKEKHPPTKETSRGSTSGPPAPAHPPAGRSVSPGRKGGDKPAVSMPRVTPPTSATSTPTHTPAVQPAGQGTTPVQAAAVAADDGAPRAAPAPGQDITAEEYKARLAEKRRQAREKAEKEAEEERKRQEEAWLAEQEKQRKEEEEQRRLEEESMRQASEARQAEEERLQRAIEAEEKRKKEESERQEQEKKAKEEADKKAKEESEKMEKEKLEKSKREEEERQARKKKLEMIMKRVKPDSQMETSVKLDSPIKSVSSSPNISHTSSSQNSPDEYEKPVTQDTTSEWESGPAPPVGSAVELGSSAMTTSFILDTDDDTSSASTVMTSSFIRSASSGDILDAPTTHDENGDRQNEGRLSSSAASTPSRNEDKGLSSEPTSETKSKFKSPLLQQLVEKKGGESPLGVPKFKSPLLQNLLGKTKVGARMGMSASTGDLSPPKDTSAADPMTSSVVLDQSGFTKEVFNQGRDDEDKDEDTSLHRGDVGGIPKSFESRHTVTNGISRDSGDITHSMSASKSSSDSSPADAISSKFPMSLMSDSALGSSIEPPMEGDFPAPGMMSQSFIINGHGDHKSHAMDDSSISLHSLDESGSTSASGLMFHSGPDSAGNHHHDDDSHFEELIDLRDSKTTSIVGGTPLLAFGENNRRQDAT
ncbi:unnamed protein product, partial [Lymnaea stagnalis]